jgi:hypothetical protein
MATLGISVGFSEGNGTRTFRPGVAASRDMMAAFFYRLAGSPAYTPGASPFTDVTPQTPFYKEILWLASRGNSHRLARSQRHQDLPANTARQPGPGRRVCVPLQQCLPGVRAGTKRNP